MTRSLLLRGMAAGLFAALLAFTFARVCGEPVVDRAIAFETAAERAAGEPPEPELVSRAVQGGVGLLTAAGVYGVAYGGLFSLVFAVAYGRLGRVSPRSLAALLALAGFVAVVLVPALKYPANPPSVGQPDTIGLRTALYFETVLIGLGAMALAVLAGRALGARLGGWTAGLAALLVFGSVVGSTEWALPGVHEVPAGFPAELLWRFRVDALAMQVILWGALGLGFGWLAERRLQPTPPGRWVRSRLPTW